MTNEYIIHSSDNSYYKTVLENTTNTETEMTLIGHGMPDYGEEQNTNFLHLLEHFASIDEPTKRVKGQIWFRKAASTGTKYELRICKDPTAVINSGDNLTTEEEEENINARWDKVPRVYTENVPDNPSNGELYYDSTEHVLKIYDGVLAAWNTIGPTDVVHSVHLFETKLVNRNNDTGIQYFYPASTFIMDINSSDDPNVTSTGSLHQVTLKILAKEFIKDTYSNDVKCCCWVYKFLVQVKHPTETNYSVDIIGSPTYELLGKTDDTEWTTSVDMSGQQVVVTFDTSDSSVEYDSYISVGFDTEIVRV